MSECQDSKCIEDNFLLLKIRNTHGECPAEPLGEGRMYRTISLYKRIYHGKKKFIK